MAPATPCDLVMRGGITSGVIYPKAVARLKDRYWFRGIGGASVGVVAAAATAAAELGRGAGGFGKLDKLATDLARDGNLLGLFQPTTAARPVFDLFVAGTTYPGTVRRFVLWRVALRPAAPVAAVVAVAVLAAALLVLRAVDALTAGWVAAAGLLALLAAAVAVPFEVYRRLDRWNDALKANRLGALTGMAGAGGRGRAALTEYLHANFADLAGLPPDTPLTFGHLAANAGGARPVDLRLMTTDLSTGRPVVFPLPAGERYLFRPAEFRALFPEAVVAHMVAHPPAEAPPVAPAAGLHFLPDPADLPVLVPVRISLGHPVLFAGVPLYGLTAAYAARAAGRPEPVTAADVREHLFSDGGIVSNFPIHMFDRWLPDGPTFGINLADAEDLAAPGPAADPGPAGRVVLPAADASPARAWRPVADLGDLAAAVFYAAKNHRDTAQAELPSYQERVVTVRLAAAEGGLNLAMPPDVIERLMGYGAEAGDTLAARFSMPAHRWTRLRVVLARLEHELRGLRAAFRADPTLAGLLAGPTAEPPAGVPFPLTPAEWAAARPVLRKLFELVDGEFPAGRGPFDVRPPAPLPAKRFVPADGGDQQPA